MSDKIIKIIDVNKKFSKKTILDDINLEIKSGEIFGIIGLSGSGKTTLLNTIIGFLQPDKGDVLFKIEHLLNYKDDSLQYRSVFNNQMDVKKLFGFASQDASVYSQLTCLENLNYFGKLYGLSKDVRKTNNDILLKLMGIYESRNIIAKNLSGGMLKRLDIACSLIHDPKVLILDEPTADLDPIMRKQMWKLIKQINEKGTTIILSSHLLDELEFLCDRVSIIYDSKILIVGTPDEIKNYYSKEQEIKIETTPGDYKKIMNQLKQLGSYQDDIKNMFITDNKLLIYSINAEVNLHQILHIIENQNEILIDVSVENPSLQDVMEKIILEKNDKNISYNY
ncbi:MAG: ABC transporter ATP-binding protein [Nanoarchaeota archaeon]